MQAVTRKSPCLGDKEARQLKKEANKKRREMRDCSWTHYNLRKKY